MQDERTRLISPCLKAGVLRRDLIKILPLAGLEPAAHSVLAI